MQLNIASDALPPDSPVKPKLAHILELMHQVGNEGRNAVQGLRPQDGDSLRLEQAFAAIEREFTEAGGGPDAQLQVTVKGRSRPLHPVFRDDVYRIGREAVINAFRHSGAKTINVEIEYHAREFRLVVRDDGRGIDPEVLRKGRPGQRGIPGMRDHAERIGAQLRVWSRPEKGTR